jgi:hypothetical protein
MAKKEQALGFTSPQVKNALFYFMIILVVGLSIFAYIKIRDGSISCMAAPIQYGISKMQSSSTQEITCSCSSPGVDNVLYYTKDNVTFGKRGGLLYP